MWSAAWTRSSAGPIPGPGRAERRRRPSTHSALHQRIDREPPRRSTSRRSSTRSSRRRWASSGTTSRTAATAAANRPRRRRSPTRAHTALVAEHRQHETVQSQLAEASQLTSSRRRNCGAGAATPQAARRGRSVACRRRRAMSADPARARASDASGISASTPKAWQCETRRGRSSARQTSSRACWLCAGQAKPARHAHVPRLRPRQARRCAGW